MLGSVGNLLLLLALVDTSYAQDMHSHTRPKNERASPDPARSFLRAEHASSGAIAEVPEASVAKRYAPLDPGDCEMGRRPIVAPALKSKT
jgi:hypothetical protein